MGVILKKTFGTLVTQCLSRGLYFTLVMQLSHITGVLRALLYKMLYWRHIQSSLFSMQANSRIEIFHRNARVQIGSFVFIRKNASLRVDHDGFLNIGDKVFINDNCNINCVHKITIGPYTKIAPNVCMNDHDHNYKHDGRGHLLSDEIAIGEHVWIGAGAIILRGTTIGDYAVIAAGSIVKGSVPAHTLYLNKREGRYIDFSEGNREVSI
jgi:acetyltransferase-like isoleucine patch superfamily enzyme